MRASRRRYPAGLLRQTCKNSSHQTSKRGVLTTVYTTLWVWNEILPPSISHSICRPRAGENIIGFFWIAMFANFEFQTLSLILF